MPRNTSGSGEAADAPAAGARGPGATSLEEALRRIAETEADERGVRRLVSLVAEAIPAADAAALLLRPEGLAEGEVLEVAAGVGLDDASPARVEDGLAREVAAGEPGGAAERPGGAPPLPSGTRRVLAAAVRAGGPDAPGGEVRGVLLVGTRGEDAFSPADRALLRAAADRAGLALRACRLAREREEAIALARRAEADARERRAAMDQILAIVGHDLRNPLGAVHMSAALLQKRGGLTGWQGKAVDRLRSSSLRMGRIIADLLSYARTRLGTGIPIVRRPADLETACRKVLDELQAANPDRTLEVSMRGDVRGEWDPDRLEQLVSNLASNALDHGDPAAPVRVEAADEGDQVVLRVVNQGDPVPREVLAHLFEPFSRPPDAQAKKGSGLGLGLFISREIVRGHGGTIAVASESGTTVIEARLPRQAAEARPT